MIRKYRNTDLSNLPGHEVLELLPTTLRRPARLTTLEQLGTFVNNGSQFDPNGTLTRAMIVTILYRAEGEPAMTAPLAFTDIQAGMVFPCRGILLLNINRHGAILLYCFRSYIER